MKSAGDNSIYSFCGQNRKNLFMHFFCGPEEKEIPCGRAGQLAAAAAAANARSGAGTGPVAIKPANCYASIRGPIPSRSRSASVAGAARLAGRAQEVLFPGLRRYRAVGASLRSACRPRKRRAKGDAASVGGGTPAGVQGDCKSARREFRAVGCEGVENERLMTADGRKESGTGEIHARVLVMANRRIGIIKDVSAGFILAVRENSRIIHIERVVFRCLNLGRKIMFGVCPNISVTIRITAQINRLYPSIGIVI